MFNPSKPDDPNRVGWLKKNLKDPEFAKAYAKEWLTEGFLTDLLILMEDREVSTEDLADKMGCSVEVVQHALDGCGDLDVSTMAEMARALGCYVCARLVPFRPHDVNEEFVRRGVDKVAQLFQDLQHTQKKIDDLEWGAARRTARSGYLPSMQDVT